MELFFLLICISLIRSSFSFMKYFERRRNLSTKSRVRYMAHICMGMSCLVKWKGCRIQNLRKTENLVSQCIRNCFIFPLELQVSLYVVI